LQIGVPPEDGLTYDTAPLPRSSPDVVFVAGYHHTHAGTASRVLREGGVAVVEKPLATTRGQLAELLEAMGPGPSRLYPCFQKRWSPANAWAREDLAVRPGEPVHYHAIVYEVPLPARHWYRWPNSRSRIVCNGCHWIDHFMAFNDYAPAVRHAAWEAANGDVVCTAELANGASLALVITDHGSGRLGVRDHVELRAGNVTVRLTDGASYESESTRGRLRRRRVARFDPYAAMYRDISTAVLDGRAGDPPAWVASATGLMLDLEDALQDSRRRRNGREHEDGR
jgi:predicted dehydrogenase